MNGEIWKDIKGYEGKYQISDMGKVKSLERLTSNKRRVLKQINLSQKLGKDGYLKVLLYKENSRKYVMVHRLVANMFIENFYNKPQVNHIDANKQNNNVSNLEWVTASENKLHALSLGIGLLGTGKDNVKSKKVNQISLDGFFIKTWAGQREVARVLKLSQSGICRCCKYGKGTIGGYKWEYTV